MIKPKISLRSWIRTLFFSVLAAFIVQGIINLDEVKVAFESGTGYHAHHSAVNVATPDFLRVPELIAGVIGQMWRWLY